MPNWIESVFKHFERLLRFVYPGALLLTLLYLSSPNFGCLKCLSYVNEIDKGIETNDLWPFLLVVTVAGIVIYYFQQLVITAFISIFTVKSGWQLEPDPDKLPWKCCRKLAGHCDGLIKTIIYRWYGEKLDSYFNYAWAINHAAFITSWLTLIFAFFIKTSDSIMDNISAIIIPSAILLLFGSIWHHLLLTRAQAKSYFK